MALVGNAGAGPDRTSPCATTPQERMAQFDALPRAAREAVARATAEYESGNILREWRKRRREGTTAVYFATVVRETDAAQAKRRAEALYGHTIVHLED